MTFEAAIAVLKELAVRIKASGMVFKAINMAIEALEKQVPKKPHKDNENGVYEKDYCPTCNRSLFPNDHHCPCGQALLWEDTE